jgi:hypothetical protein
MLNCKVVSALNNIDYKTYIQLTCTHNIGIKIWLVDFPLNLRLNQYTLFNKILKILFLLF